MAMTLSELKKHKTEIELELEQKEREYKRAHTNHILHLLLCVFTVGFWVIIWLIIANSNIRRRAKLEKTINEYKRTLVEIESELIPAAKTQASKPVEKDTIECPWCAEDILAKAKICKHCGKEVQNPI